MAYSPTNWVNGVTPINAANLNKIEQGIAAAEISGTIPDATTTVKGKIMLAGDLAGTADLPTVPLAVKTNAVDQTIGGNKTFSNPLTVATPTINSHATTKLYVDSAVAGATIVDATTSVKGKIQLGGDLAGTSAAPTVPGLALKANIASPTLTGTPLAPTAGAGTNTTQIATTAFVTGAVNGVTTGFAPLSSPNFTGTPTAPTATAGTNTTQVATTAYVDTGLNLKANANNAVLTGTVTVPDNALPMSKVSGLSSALANKPDLTSGILSLATAPSGYTHHEFCPGNVMTTPTMRSDIRVVWHKSTAPTAGSRPNALPRDGWIVWDG